MFTPFLTRGGVPTDPNKVYSVSNHFDSPLTFGASRPLRPSLDTRGGVPTAPTKVYSVSNKAAIAIQYPPQL